MRITQLIFWAMLFLSCNYTFAQSQLFSIKNYTSENGLPDNCIYSIRKDVNGFYWIYTKIGFTRWDGNEFVTYATPSIPNYNKPIINDDKIVIHSAVYKRHEGYYTIIIDTLSKIYKTTKTFRKDMFLTWNVDGYNTNKVLYLDTSVQYFEKNEKASKPIDVYTLSYRCKMLPDNANTFYMLDYADTVYYAKNNKIIHWEKVKNTVNENFLIDKKLVSLNLNAGNYTILNAGKIVQKGKIDFHNIESKDCWASQSNHDNAIIAVKNCLYRLTVNSLNELQITRIVTLPEYDGFNCFFYDENTQKTIVGTIKNGIKIYKPKKITTVKSNIPGNNNIIYSQALINNKITNNQDVFLKEYDYKKVPWGWIYTGPILELPNKQILSGSNTFLTLFTENLTLKKTWWLKNYMVTGFLKTDSTIYVVSSTLGKYYPKENRIVETSFTDWPQKGNLIFVVYPSKKANCIYAVIGETLQELNLKEKTSTILAKGITGEPRHLLYDSSTQCFFISTHYNGCYFLPRNGKLMKLPETKNNVAVNCHYVLPDKQGDFWLPTNNGLYFMFKQDFLDFINKKKLNIEYKKYGKSDGILNEEFNGGFEGAGIIVNDSIHLATMDGTVVFSPLIKYIDSKKAGTLMIDYVKIDDSTYAINKHLQVPAGFKQIAIKAVYPYADNENDIVKYRIIGTNDTSWSVLKKDEIIEIKSLPSGEYAIDIRVNNSTTSTQTVKFYIAPYWYKTWWMYSIYALIVCISLYIFFNWRLVLSKNKQLRELELSKSRLFTAIAHDLQSPINNFVGLADTMKFLIAEKDFDTIATLGTEMDKKSRNLTLLLGNILNWSLEEQALQANTTNIVNLQLVFATVLPLYKDIAATKNITVINQTTGQVLVKTNEQALSIITRNLIDNAIKNTTYKGFINIYAQQNTNSIYLQISNTASDMAIQKLKGIQTMLVQSKSIVPLANGVGLGLALVHSNVMKLGGNIKIGINEHTITFYVEIPNLKTD